MKVILDIPGADSATIDSVAAALEKKSGLKIESAAAPLKKGDRVEVFERPVEREGSEGVATLVSKEMDGNWDYYPDGIDNPPRLLELWAVRFAGDPTIGTRKVSPSDKL